MQPRVTCAVHAFDGPPCQDSPEGQQQACFGNFSYKTAVLRNRNYSNPPVPVQLETWNVVRRAPFWGLRLAIYLLMFVFYAIYWIQLANNAGIMLGIRYTSSAWLRAAATGFDVFFPLIVFSYAQSPYTEFPYLAVRLWILAHFLAQGALLGWFIYEAVQCSTFLYCSSATPILGVDLAFLVLLIGCAAKLFLYLVFALLILSLRKRVVRYNWAIFNSLPNSAALSHMV